MSRDGDHQSDFGPAQPFAKWLAAAVLACAIVMIYYRALDGPFFCDDAISIVENESIQRLWPLWGDAQQPGPLRPALDLPTCGRPLVNFSFALNYCWSELQPRGYRVVNILLHLLNALLLGALVQRVLLLPYFGGRFAAVAGPLAFAAALLWAVHPLVTETVVYVTQRTELMVSFCYLATLYCSLRYWVAARTSWLVLAVLACWAGMASKEVMASAPVMVLLFDRIFVAGSFREAWRRSRPLYLGLFTSWALLLLLNYGGPRSKSAGFHLGVSAIDWWFTQANMLLMYLKLAVWPWPLSIHYEPPYVTTIGEAWVYLVPVALLAGATLVLVWRGSGVGFVGAFVFAILAPTLVVPVVTEIAAERRMYLPLAALVTLVVVGGYDVLRRYAGDRTALVALGGVALVLACVGGVASSQRLAVYGSEFTLWQDVVDHFPENPTAAYNVGTTLLDREQFQESIPYFQRAIAHQPNYAKAHHNLGSALAAVGQLDAAIAEFRRAVDIQPNYALALNKLGTALVKAGQAEKAIPFFERGVELLPNDAESHNALGAALAQTGQFEEAATHFASAVRLDPTLVQAYGNLMAAYATLGRTNEALAAAEKALQLARSAGDTALAEKISAFIARYQTVPPNPPVPAIEGSKQ